MIGCADVRERAAEVALGALPGDERARFLTHLAGCPTCEALVAELSLVADSLLQLAPGIDPPAGFEGRVLDAIAAVPAPVPLRHRRRFWVGVGAIAAALALIAGTAMGLAQRTGDHYPGALGTLRSGSLVGPHNENWGEAVVSQGNPSWVFVAMRWDVPDGSYRVELDRSDGLPITLAGLELTSGEGSFGHVVAGAGDVTEVRVVDDAGHTICVANLKQV